MAKGEFIDLANLSFFTLEQATEEGGNRELAVFTADQVLANSKKDEALILYYIAPAYSIAKDHKKAIDVLERALKAFDASPYAKDEQMKGLRTEIENALKKEKESGG